MLLENTKPCPFCGNTEIYMQDGSTFRWVEAVCNRCGARCGEVRLDTMIDRDEAYKNVIPKLTKEWNERR